MTPLQKLQMEQSENREKLLAFARQTDLSADDRTEMGTRTKRAESIELEIHTAITTESESPLEVRHGEPMDKETRELTGLLKRSSIGAFLREAATERTLDGVERELGEGSAPNLLPLEMLIPVQDMERRADAVSTVSEDAIVDGSQAPILRRVFTKSIAARMMVDQPMVPVGAANYPILTGGVTGGAQLPDGTQEAEAAVFGGATLEPLRLTARYLFRVEDASRLRNYEEVLRIAAGAREG